MGKTTQTSRGTPDVITIVLDSLANDAVVQSTAEFENASNLDLWCTMMFNLASLNLSTQDNPALYVWFLEKINSIQETYISAPAKNPSAIIPLEVGIEAAAQIKPASNPKIYCPNIDFDIIVQNKTGVNFAGSGNTLTLEAFGVTTA